MLHQVKTWLTGVSSWYSFLKRTKLNFINQSWHEDYFLNWYYFIDIDIFSYSSPKSEHKQKFNFHWKIL